MVVDEHTLSKMRRNFSLNLYEAKILAALLSRGISTAGELSDIADVPRSRAYDVAESLEKRGFVIMKLGKPIKYMAIPPKELIDRAQKNSVVAAEKMKNRLENLRDSELMNDLEVLYSKGVEYFEATDMTGAVRGRQNIHHLFSSMISKANSSVVIATSGEGVVRKYESLKRSLKAAKEKGVSIRFLSSGEIDNKKVISELKKFADVKVAADLDSRFCIVDEKDVAFMTMKDNEVHTNYDVAVWVNSKMFASTLQSTFDRAWNEN